MDDIYYLELAEIAELIRTRQISPVELTHTMLGRIADVDRQLQSYVFVNGDNAVQKARELEQELLAGKWRGPLHGMPVAVKDLFERDGYAVAAGMPIRKGKIAHRTATAVRRLEDAGAIILGNLVMTEGAHGDHRPPDFPAPKNPWNANLWPGASSSGSGVATAAGLCFAALGTETGGSIRLPAAANGITGLKPTWGRVSRHGVFELSASLDHVGPLARSARDAGLVLGAIAGADPDDPTASPEPVDDYSTMLDGDLRGIRIGLDREVAYSDMSEVVASAFATALETILDLGATIVPIKLPDIRPMVAGYLPLSAVQTAVAHEAIYPASKEGYGPSLTELIELGLSLKATEFQKLLLLQMEFRGRVDELFERCDLLALPVLAKGVPTVSDMQDMTEDVIEGIVRYTSPFAMSGHPAISFPCGASPAGSPINMQFVGARFREALLVRSVHAFQGQSNWHRRRPL